MPTAANALLHYEAGQTPVSMTALTDSGDQTTFSAATSPFSRKGVFAPVVRPDGLLTGGAVTVAASGSNDVVDVAAGTAYIAGASVTWSADTDVSITRAVSTDTHAITSITITDAGAVAAVAGTDGTSFSSVRGASGGPPLIPTTSIEIAQIRTTSFTAAAIVSSEIYAVPGLHLERSDYPGYSIDYLNGTVTFYDNLPTIHTGSLPKNVHASYATPVFAAVPSASNFKPPATSYSISTEQTYDGPKASSTSSVNSGSFDALLNDGVSDSLANLVGENIWFKFWPNRYSTAIYHMCQGIIGYDPSFPVESQIKGTFTIIPESVGENVIG